ncbi:serine incorporator [Tripterygium wilfordii]|uniref:Serine incorporator n=1 Tax=Tripterygium wilfordii TaxID=458696 RepID=A0A7J7BWR8_TRIWF|nr:serine incorporator [Tripterygium wilfordii]
MESGANNSSRHAVLKDSSWFSQFRNGCNPWMARYAYGLMFLASYMIAWAVRDYGRGASKQIEKLKGCASGDCWGADGTLRVSMGCFAFYIVMFLSTIGTKKLNKCQDSWHSGWWSVKIALFIVLMIITFLVPSAFVKIYGEVAHFGAGEPGGQSCNKKAEASSKTDWLTIISFVVAVLAMVIATFSTGIDSQCFQFRKENTQAEDDIPYGYGFFHFVFATGAMYFSMLLIGWNTHHTIKRWTIDVGWTSVWVRIVNEWLAVCVYNGSNVRLRRHRKIHKTGEEIDDF